MPAFNEITAAQLSRLIGLPDAPVIVDLCLDEDFAQAPNLIPGSFRWPHSDLPGLLTQIGTSQVVTVCQKGKKISQGAAAILRTHGSAAEYLGGGAIGWAEAGLPIVPADAIPQPGRGTLWVTRHRPKVERIACPWLIRRFVDPTARFMFVAPAEVTAVAERFDATPFDAPGATLGHDGDTCTFDALLTRFGLTTDPLLRLATVVRGADTNQLDLAPQCAGLLAASLGLSRMCKDDLTQLDAGFALYDMLYRWARDAADEMHDRHDSAAAGS